MLKKVLSEGAIKRSSWFVQYEVKALEQHSYPDFSNRWFYLFGRKRRKKVVSEEQFLGR